MKIVISNTKVYDENNTIDETAKVFEIKNNKGLIVGCYSGKYNKIFVWAIISFKKGFMKKAMNKICKKFNTQNVIFINVISIDLVKKLRNFNPFFQDFKGEKILCLEGKWDTKYR